MCTWLNLSNLGVSEILQKKKQAKEVERQARKVAKEKEKQARQHAKEQMKAQRDKEKLLKMV